MGDSKDAKTLKEIHKEKDKKPFRASPTEGPNKDDEFQFIEPDGDDFRGVRTEDEREIPCRHNGDERKWRSTEKK